MRQIPVRVHRGHAVGALLPQLRDPRHQHCVCECESERLIPNVELCSCHYLRKLHKVIDPVEFKLEVSAAKEPPFFFQTHENSVPGVFF